LPSAGSRKLILLGQSGRSITPRAYDELGKQAYAWETGTIRNLDILKHIHSAAIQSFKERKKATWHDLANTTVQHLTNSTSDKRFEILHRQLAYRTILANVGNLIETNSGRGCFFVHCRRLTRIQDLILALGALSRGVMFTYSPGYKQFKEGAEGVYSRLYVCKEWDLVFMREAEIFDEMLKEEIVRGSGRVLFIPTPNFICRSKAVAEEKGEHYPTMRMNTFGIGMNWATDFDACAVEYEDEAVFSAVPPQRVLSFNIPIFTKVGAAHHSPDDVESYWQHLAGVRHGIERLLAAAQSASNSRYAIRDMESISRDVKNELSRLQQTDRRSGPARKSSEFQMMFCACDPDELEGYLSKQTLSHESGLFPYLYAERLKGEIEIRARNCFLLAKIVLPSRQTMTAAA
jgi:hypothetical protein